MASINLHGGTGGPQPPGGGGGNIPPGGGGPGGRPPAGQAVRRDTTLEGLFRNLLKHPNPAAERAFEMSWKAKFPNAELLVPIGQKYLAGRLAAINAAATRGNITPTAHRRLLEESKRISESMKTYSRLTGSAMGGTIRGMNAQMWNQLHGLGGVKTSEQVALINRLGGGAVTAAMRGDKYELRKIEKILEKIEKTEESQLKVLSGAQPGSPKAHERAAHQRSLAAINDIRQRVSTAKGMAPHARFSDLTRLIKSPVVGLIAKAIGITIGAPMVLGGVASGLLAGSSDYTGTMRTLGRVGRLGGANAYSLYSKLAPGGWNKGNPLLAAAGIEGPQQAAKVLEAYGMPISSSNPLLTSLAYSRGLRGMGGLGLMQRVGLLSQGASLGVNVTAKDQHYLQKLSSLFTGSLNKSEVLNAILGSLRLISGGGAAGMNTGAMSKLMGRFMSSGAPTFRTAAGITGAFGSIGASINSLNQNPVTTAFYLRGVYARNGGRLPRNRAELSSILGKGALNSPFAKSAAGQHLIANLLHAGASGNAYMFNILSQPFLKGNYGQYAKMLGQGFGGTPWETAALGKALFPGQSQAVQMMGAYAYRYGIPGSAAGKVAPVNLLNKMMGNIGALNKTKLQGSGYLYHSFATEFAKTIPAVSSFNTEMDKGAKAVDKFTTEVGKFAHKVEHGIGNAIDRVIKKLNKASGWNNEPSMP